MIIEKLKSFFKNDPDIKDRIPQNLKTTDSLIESGIVDSLSIMSLVAFIQKNFGIKIEQEDFVQENFETLEHIKKFIQEKL